MIRTTLDGVPAPHMDNIEPLQQPPTPPPLDVAPPHPPAYEWAPAPPAHAPTSPLTRAWPLGLSRGLAILLIGVVAGGAGGYVAFRIQSPTTGAAEILVDNSPVHGGGSAEAVASHLGPAVATIIARQGTASASLGSGFVIARTGGSSFLLTNNHVVTGSNDLHVLLPDGRAFTATLVGTDTLDDLAVVSVPDTTLAMATFGDSSKLHVGQMVVAIGSPLGNQSSVTQGVISSLHRTINAGSGQGTTSETLEDVLQTDASINPGNSGGPLADIDARVVGVNVAIAGNATNIGYSIPANLAREVATALIQHKPVQHPFLGIGYLDAINAVEAGQGFSGPGVLVTTVSPGTPAATAGFQKGDILVAIDGVAIDNGQTLGGLIQNKQVGQSVAFTVRRGGQTMTLSGKLEERPGNL